MRLSVGAWSKFSEVSFTLPIDWTANPTGSPIWEHHFLSLRWIFGSPPRTEVIEAVLADFLSYHTNPRNKVSQFYTGRAADHTCAERLVVFSRVLREFYPDFSTEFPRALFRREIIYLMRVLVSDAIYRPRTNHGLQMDLAIMEFLGVHRNFLRECPYAEYCENRAIEQLKGIFSPGGDTHEHSISYQEYNLAICARIIESLRPLKIFPTIVKLAEETISRGAGMLISALKPTLEYAPLGDSFRVPSRNRVIAIAKHLPDPDAIEFTNLLSGRKGQPSELGLFLYPGAGFAFIRTRRDILPEVGNTVHLSFTCCWHSHVHKQQDETSFTLFFKGRDIIDDPGFSDILVHREEGRRVVKEAGNHSLLTIKGLSWNQNAPRGSSRLIASVDDGWATGIAGVHQRMEGYVVYRYIWLIKERTVVVYDRIVGEHIPEFHQAFVVGADVEPSITSASFDLQANGSRLGEVYCVSESPVELLLESTSLVREHALVKTHKIGFVGTGTKICSALKLDPDDQDCIDVLSVQEISDGRFEIAIQQNDRVVHRMVSFNPLSEEIELASSNTR